MGSEDVTWSFSFTAWKSGQPHSDPTKAEAKDCVKIDTTKLWGLVDCSKEKNYACQIAAKLVTTTLGSTEFPSSATTLGGSSFKSTHPITFSRSTKMEEISTAGSTISAEMPQGSTSSLISTNAVASSSELRYQQRWDQHFQNVPQNFQEFRDFQPWTTVENPQVNSFLLQWWGPQ